MPPGPPPKKKAERRRRNKDGADVEVINLDEVLAGEREVPVTPDRWEPIPTELFDSMKRSGQAIFMEPSDWATALVICETLDRALKPQDVRTGEIRPSITDGGEVEYVFTEKTLPVPGSTLTAVLKGLSSLMATEGDRRRLKLELERQSAIDAAASGGVVVSITQSREEAFRQAAQPG